MRQRSSQILLMLQGALTGNHDAHCLRGTGAMHGLGAVANSCRAQAQVLDQTHHAQAVLGGHLILKKQI